VPVHLHPNDTIAALAYAPGPGLRGIVRISGPSTQNVLEELFTPASVDGASFPFSAAWCQFGALRITGISQPVPVDLYLWPNRRSYTGQPLAELHTIGSPPVLEAILADLFSRDIRPAQPGEFTLRAFLAGRIDLTQAEAVLGVIDARSDGELATALDQLAGGLSSQIVRLRGDLLDLLADLEAGLDFADEPIEFVSHVSLVGRLGLARDVVAELLERATQRMRSSPRPRVVLAGPPNAGKSTLFNALTRGTRPALVSETAGTTRDYLSAEATLDGLLVELIDTAGETAAAGGGIEREAQKMRDEQVEQADLVLWCQSADQPVVPAVGENGRTGEERLLAVRTKSDLARGADFSPAHLSVSAHSGAGLPELVATIVARLSSSGGDERQLLGTTAARSFDALQKAILALDRALAIARKESDQELLAIEVRDALDELGTIAGEVYTDDILDCIFSRFCIGK
jgi:tRNA modification GTPase